jgi:hypothetical protein
MDAEPHVLLIVREPLSVFANWVVVSVHVVSTPIAGVVGAVYVHVRVISVHACTVAVCGGGEAGVGVGSVSSGPGGVPPVLPVAGAAIEGMVQVPKELLIL